MTSIEEIKKYISYDSKAGTLIWFDERGYRRPSNRVIKSLNYEGYIRFNFDGKCLLGHRVAWALFHGSWPNHGLDHINGNRADNRIDNLRSVPQVENARNQIQHRNGKLWGANKTKYNKWQSRFRMNGKRYYFGNFKTEAEAHNNSKKMFDSISPSV